MRHGRLSALLSATNAMTPSPTNHPGAQGQDGGTWAWFSARVSGRGFDAQRAFKLINLVLEQEFSLFEAMNQELILIRQGSCFKGE